jgi:hypothetical protein
LAFFNRTYFDSSQLQATRTVHTMGNVHGSKHGVDTVRKMEEDLRVLRTVSPEVACPIDWEQERSVDSHVCINTMTNQINIERSSRRRSLTLPKTKSLEHIVHLVVPGRRSPKAMQRSVSFATELAQPVPVDAVGCYDFDDESLHGDGEGNEGCERIPSIPRKCFDSIPSESSGQSATSCSADYSSCRTLSLNDLRVGCST